MGYHWEGYRRGVRLLDVHRPEKEICPVCGEKNFACRRMVSHQDLYECTFCGFGGFKEFIETVKDKRKFYKHFLRARLQTLKSLLPSPKTIRQMPFVPSSIHSMLKEISRINNVLGKI